MKIIDSLLKTIGLQRRAELPQANGPGDTGRLGRRFAGAKATRLLNGWSRWEQPINKDLAMDLGPLRARARDLVKNTSTGARFNMLARINIIGADGVRLQVQGRNEKTQALDTAGNKAIEQAWQIWGRAENCTVTGRISFSTLCDMLAVGLASQDGEILVRHRRGYKNAFSYAVQQMDVGLLDHTFNRDKGNSQNEVRAGVEYNEDLRPVRYHFRDRANGKTWSLPAEEIIHAYVDTFVGQARGWPPCAPVMNMMKQLDAYEEAEVTAARAEASKVAALQDMKSGDGDPGVGLPAGETDEDGATVMDLDPVTILNVPSGKELVGYDPTHPNTAFDPFLKSMKREVASGLGPSYHSMTGDLSGVNYSSIRAGMLDEREYWRWLQRVLKETVLNQIYDAWLLMTLMSGYYSWLPASRYEKFRSVRWHFRTWQWVDPLKEVQAAAQARELGLETHTEQLAQQGKDFEDVMDEFIAEEAHKKKLGLNFGVKTQPKAPPNGQPQDDKEDE